MGNGELVRVADPWLPKPHSFKPVLRIRAPYIKVSELIRADRQGWRLEELAALVSPDDLDLI